ncbi:MAG: glycosyltransferase family 39 protein [Micrococcales bacterium]|nr:glycosyltransferase family 39 protein [Micrococcales bacterium]
MALSCACSASVPEHLARQALMGVATVGLLYLFVARYFGRPAGLLAGVILATTPVATLMFRFNNPDAAVRCWSPRPTPWRGHRTERLR